MHRHRMCKLHLRTEKTWRLQLRIIDTWHVAARVNTTTAHNNVQTCFKHVVSNSVGNRFVSYWHKTPGVVTKFIKKSCCTTWCEWLVAKNPSTGYGKKWGTIPSEFCPLCGITDVLMTLLYHKAISYWMLMFLSFLHQNQFHTARGHRK